MTAHINRLEKTLKATLPPHEFQHICTYLFSNPGKLFRSTLIQNLAKDLGLGPSQKNDIELLEAFIEIHHTYTLIHDDLPSMDDDKTRRGLESTHIRYGEANAVLAGDALIISSFNTLSKMKGQYISKMLKLTTWATGAKGLINGQYLDLQNHEKSFEEILRIYELKTSRLFQICTLGTYFIQQDGNEIEYKKLKDFMRIGSYVGILFQLLDDFHDRNDTGAKFNNLFYIDEVRASEYLRKYSEKLGHILSRYQLRESQKQLSAYTKSVGASI